MCKIETGHKMGRFERDSHNKKFRGKVQFVGTTYPTMDSLKAVFKALIVKSKNDVMIEGIGKEQLTELLKHHEKADDKLKALKGFTVSLHPDYKDTRCFFVIKEDDTKEDFSFHKCLNNLAESLDSKSK